MHSAISALLLTLVLLWAGIDWRWAWLIACPLGIALALRQCWSAVLASSNSEKLTPWQRIRRWAQTRDAPGGLMSLLVLSFHLQALGGLGLQYDSRDEEMAWVAILGVCFVVLGCIVLLQVLLACCVSVFRVLRFNQPWPAQALAPRAALLAGMRWLVIGAAWGGIVWVAIICATSRHSLNLVDELGRQGIQVFTQARYVQEQFRINYLLATVEGTPKPAWHELMRPKSIDEALAQSRHPGDRWSNVVQSAKARAAELYINEDTQNFDHGISTFGRRHAQAQGRPELARLIVHVDPGSPADKAGIKRGDQLERYVSVSEQTQSAVISQTINDAYGDALGKTSTKTITITIAAPAIYGKTTVSSVSFLLGDKLLEDVPKDSPLLNTERINGLYVAVYGFDLNLDQEIKRKLEFAYGLALGHVPTPFFMRDIETVVLDLRSNGGGYVSTIFPLAHVLVGPQFAKDKHYNEKSLDEYSPQSTKPKTLPIKWRADKIDRRDPLFRLAPKRLIVLTSPATCSAAELFIHAIREQLMPSAQITVIGEPTCGKPYGFPHQTYFGYQHSVISTATVDAQGQPAYPKGIQPDCLMRDDFKSEVLSSQDALWQAARHVIQTGQCQAEKPTK